jgi:hypothetical protein
MRTKFVKSFIAALTLLIVFSCLKNSTIVVVTADMVQHVNNRRIKGKIFVKGNKYRMDITENNKELSILVNRESGKHTVLIHSQKVAREYLATGSKSLSNNPFEYFNSLLEKYPSKENGSEVLDGYECKKGEVYKNDTKLVTAWVSNKLNWPIKIKTHNSPQRDVILENIKEEPVKKDLFNIPKGYKFYPLPEPKKEKDPNKSPNKRKMENVVDLSERKKAVSKKVDEKGIERETEDGKIAVREFGASVLKRCFPNWSFFNILREKEGNKPSENIIVAKTAVSNDAKNVYFLYRLEDDTSLTDIVKMAQDKNLEFNNEKNVEELGKALLLLYLRGSRIESVESLGKNKWVIYKKSNSEYVDGFIVEVNDSGEITELNYKTKIKKQ